MTKLLQAEQLSIFDIELPPNTPESISPELSKESERINFARVPDDEYMVAANKPKDSIPTVNEILKMLEKGLYRVNAHEFLSDVFECGAIAISNRFDITNYQPREERYLQIIKSHYSGFI